MGRSVRLLLGLIVWMEMAYGLRAQEVFLDSIAQSKVLQHSRLKGEARYHSALELAETYITSKKNSAQDKPLPQVYAYCYEARQIARRLGRPDLESQALMKLAGYHFRWKHADSLQRTLTLFRELVKRAPRPLIRYRSKHTEAFLAEIQAEAQADTQHIFRVCRELIDLARRTGLTDELRSARQYTIHVANYHGNWPLSIQQEKMLLEHDLATGDYGMAGNRYEGLHGAYLKLNMPDSAQLMLREAFRLHLRVPDRYHQAGFLLRMGNYYTAAGQHRKANSCFYTSQQILDSVLVASRSQGHPDAPQHAMDVSVVRGNMAGNYLNLNELDSSAFWLHRAHQPMRLINSTALDAYINFQLASIYLKQNRADSALIRIDSASLAVGSFEPQKAILHFSVRVLRATILNRFRYVGAGRADVLMAHRYLLNIREQFPEADTWKLFHRLEFFHLAYEQLELLGEMSRAFDALDYYALMREKMRRSEELAEKNIISEFEITSRERKIEVLNLQQQLDQQLQQRQYMYLGAGAVLLLLALGFVWTWVRRSRERRQQNRLLTAENKTLEAQNAELESASHELRAVVAQLNDQHLLLERRQNHLNQSLHFATAIQQQFLGNRQRLRDWLGHHLLYYEPRDEVSGDFYWWRLQGSRLLVAVIDCTGHGVPGALMSILAFHLLEDWFEHHAEASPAHALTFLDDSIRRTLRQKREDEDAALDGMDLAFIECDLQSGALVFAGARRDLWLRRGGAWRRIEATRRSIGGRTSDEVFSNRTLELLLGDRLYAFTDGVTDQFGGPRRRKLGTEALLTELATYDGLGLAEAEARFGAFFSSWRGSNARLDDALLLGLAVHPQAAAHAP